MRIAARTTGLLDAIYPRSCLGCDSPVDLGHGWLYLCPHCVERLDWIHPPMCQTCGHPFPGMGLGQHCDHCAELEPVYEAGRACLLHRGLAARMVHQLKYHDGRYLKQDVQAVVRRLADVSEFVRDAVLVPVPLHPARERERGFNQSLWLAEAWAAVLPVGGVKRLLRRSRWTTTQTRLSRADRQRNMRGAFDLRAGVSVRSDLTYVVVDDVFTTGSTLNECCRALRQAGAERVKVLTLAHG